MVRFLACVALALLAASPALAGDMKNEVLPPCEDQACNHVAKTITLPEAAVATELKIRMGSMILEIPSAVTRIDMAKSVTVFRYEVSPPVLLSVETDKTVPFLNVKSPPVSLNDAMQIIFTKTVKDRDITEKYDAAVVNRLMWAKKELWGKSGEAYVYTRENIRIYYIPGSGDPFKNLAWAIDSRYPDTAIRLESNHHRNDFLKMVYSIRLLKEKEK
ncbi:MAG: hypothetical protein HGA41_02850 [Syntrophaceae bacterium]|nr:hypothetical protein [Syntrophaceae bacterium]